MTENEWQKEVTENEWQKEERENEWQNDIEVIAISKARVQ